MKFNQEEQHLKQVLDTVNTPPISDLNEKVIGRLHNETRFTINRGLKITLATCLCLFLSVNILAAASPNFKELLSLIGYQMERYLQPINLVDEADGIKLEVLGAMNDDDTVVVYLTLQDLTSDRIDETLDIYNFTLSGARILNIQTIDYNEDTHTATLRLQGNGGKKMNGKTVYLGIKSFLSDKVFYEDLDISLDFPSLLSNEVETITLNDSDSSGGGGLITMDTKSIQVLKPNELSLTLPELDFVTISNVGYINNQLHIQTKWRDDSIDDHGYFYFVNESGEKVDIPTGGVSFGVNKNNETQYGRNMEEYIFDITPEQLATLQLKGNFVTANQYTEGDWKVKFKLESVKDFFKQNVNIQVNENSITEISISSLGLALQATSPLMETDLSISLTLKNGDIIHLSNASSMSVQNDFHMKFLLPDLIELEEIKIITINGEELEL